MHWTKLILISALFIWWSCEDIQPDVYDNPIDDEETPLDTPALVFFPDSVNVQLGTGTTLQVFAMGIDNLSGAHIQIEYDQNRLTLLSLTVGDFFETAEEITFFSQHDEVTGVIDIYTSYLGADSVSVDGTGSLAYLVFTTTMAGLTNVTYSTSCEFVDPENTPINIASFGEGVINAQ